MSEGWGSFLDGAPAGTHAVQVYAADRDLVESVVRFLRSGIAAGEAGVVVATPEHARAVAAAFDADAPLVFADAERALASLYEGTHLSEALFLEVVGDLLDQAAARGQRVRVFGEMVDLLHARGRREEAIALEQLWNRLLGRRPFSLLCGYRVDVFDLETQQATLPLICDVHTHALPAHDVPRFEHAVERALTDVLGARRASDVLYIVDRPKRSRRIPPAQDALRWLAEAMPPAAERVLASARLHYASSE